MTLNLENVPSPGVAGASGLPSAFQVSCLISQRTDCSQKFNIRIIQCRIDRIKSKKNFENGLHTRTSQGVPRTRPHSNEVNTVASTQSRLSIYLKMGAYAFEPHDLMALNLLASRYMGYGVRLRATSYNAWGKVSLAVLGALRTLRKGGLHIRMEGFQ